MRVILKFKQNQTYIVSIIKIQNQRMQSKYKERAIPLVSVDAISGKYMLTPEAGEFIRSIPGPIGVVSVAGLYRTGKSYLLNQMLLNRSNGFGVGPTINPCTKGLWCWGTPIKGESADGQKLNIIVIDTEGIGALDEDQTHDTKIFTLAILASSCFIYNSVGNIDQTALQNLSLVVNLTKHIQVRSQKSVTDQDPERISNYFPSFFWVVRDFSLKISDTEGKQMTPKQYLEKALAPQKGVYSEDIEQKNKIRKMLTSFFKERQCFTLVRPLIDETKLQDLDKMSFDDLRPEFVNQVINFRKRVVGRMKPKVLNGQKLSGELYLSMLNSYVGAINEGAVPNIENAWNYMVQEQCTKVMTESLEIYESEVRQIKIPCSAEEMNKAIQSAQQLALEKFKKKSIGEDSQRYYKEIKNRMKARAIQLKKINAEDGKSTFKKYVTPFVTGVSHKIQNNQFSTFQQFTAQLKNLEDKITKDGPNYVDANLNLQVVLNKVLAQGVGYLSKRMRNEKEQTKKTLEQKNKILQNEIDCLKKQRDAEQSSTRQRLTQQDKEKLDLLFKIEKLEIELQKTREEKNNEQGQLTKNLTAKKNEIQQIRRQFQVKLIEATSKFEQISNILHESKSSWEKERAILELKVKQQSQKIQDLQLKTKNSSAKLLMDTTEMREKHRQQTMKFQNQIQQYVKNLAELKEKNQRYQQSQNSLRQKLANMSEKLDTTERKLRDETSSKAKEIERMINEHQGEIARVRNEMSQNMDDSEKQARQLEERTKKQESKSQELINQLKALKNKYQKQNQLLNSQLQNATLKYEEQKSRHIQTKAIYEGKIAAIEEDSGLQREEQVQKKIAELKSTHEEEMRKSELELRETKRQLNSQIQELNRIRNKFELQVRVLTESLTNEKKENQRLKDENAEKDKQFERQMRSYQRQRQSELINKEGHLNLRIAALEAQIEEARENYYIQKNESENRANQEITQIKNQYEMQKDRQQQRYNDDKEKLKKKYTEEINRLKNQLRQETENYQQDRERMQSQFQNEIDAAKQCLNSLTHEKDTLTKERANLERDLTKLQERFNKMETELNDRLQKLMETSKNEKDSLTKKLEELQFNKNEMEKQILSLTHERDQFRNQSQKQTSQIDELKSFNNSLTSRFESTKSSLEERLKSSQEQCLRERSRYETDLALLQQKKDFSEQKITQMDTQLKSMKQTEQQKMRLLKEKYEEERSLSEAKQQAERNSFKEKLEKMKKESSEKESVYLKQLGELDRLKSVNEQKIEFLEKKVTDTEYKSANQIMTLQDQLKNLRQKSTTELSQLKIKVGELQDNLQMKEHELSDQRNTSDIKIALNENKIKMLEERLQAILKEKTETCSDLNRKLEDARRKNQNEKSSQQLTHQEILSRMQSKYRNEISQLSQDVTRRTQQVQFMGKEHERAIKDLNEKLALQRQARTGLETKLARVQNDYLQKQNKYISEFDKIRSQKQNMSVEVQKLISREKELAKNKITQFERKMTEFDRQRQTAVFEKEKQEAKWSTERGKYQSEIEELKQQLERERNDTKKLTKDVEKLKADRADKKKNTSFIKQNQTTIMNREQSSQNKENNQTQ